MRPLLVSARMVVIVSVAVALALAAIGVAQAVTSGPITTVSVARDKEQTESPHKYGCNSTDGGVPRSRSLVITQPGQPIQPKVLFAVPLFNDGNAATEDLQPQSGDALKAFVDAVVSNERQCDDLGGSQTNWTYEYSPRVYYRVVIGPQPRFTELPAGTAEPPARDVFRTSSDFRCVNEDHHCHFATGGALNYVPSGGRQYVQLVIWAQDPDAPASCNPNDNVYPRVSNPCDELLFEAHQGGSRLAALRIGDD